jgi:hypothetical protein
LISSLTGYRLADRLQTKQCRTSAGRAHSTPPIVVAPLCVSILSLKTPSSGGGGVFTNVVLHHVNLRHFPKSIRQVPIINPRQFLEIYLRSIAEDEF